MADGLVISGGGSIEVATDSLFERATCLEDAEAMLRSALHHLAGIDGMVDRVALRQTDAPLSAARAENAIHDVSILIARSADLSGRLAADLHTAAACYGLVEGAVQRASQALFAELGWGLGLIGSTIGPLLVPGAVGFLASGAAAFGVLGVVAPGTSRSLREHAEGISRDVLSDPRFVELVRLGVMSADDVGAGALRVPRPLAQLMGDEGIGAVGLDTSAAAVVGAAGVAGLLRETRIAVTPASVTSSTAAYGIAQRAARIPSGPDQIRIDRYVAPGQPDRYEIYLGGTIDFSPNPTTEPFDLTSNVHGLAGADAGAYRAVRAALEAQGVPEGAPIVVTGYSQGGLLGAQLAASGEYNVTGLLTLGAPAGQVPVPESVAWIALEHDDDLVPALGGSFASDEAVLVRRDAGDGRQNASEYVFPAHQLERYRETATITDDTSEHRLVEATREFDSPGRDEAVVTSTWYRGERVE